MPAVAGITTCSRIALSWVTLAPKRLRYSSSNRPGRTALTFWDRDGRELTGKSQTAQASLSSAARSSECVNISMLPSDARGHCARGRSQ